MPWKLQTHAKTTSYTKAILLRKPIMKTVLITGASSGIGYELASQMLKKGYRVVGTSRNPAHARSRMASQIADDQNFTLLALNQNHVENIEVFFNQHEALLSSIDILVNNAGSGQLGDVETSDWEDLRSIMSINCLGPMRLTQLLVPILVKNKGLILMVGSLVAHISFPYKAAYCGAKGGLTSFTWSLRYELLQRGVRVHLLEPGWVKTRFHENLPPIHPKMMNGPYGKSIRPFADMDRDKDPRTCTADHAASVALSMIENPKAPFRKGCGRDYHLVRLGRRLLPDTWVDFLVRTYLTLKERHYHHKHTS